MKTNSKVVAGPLCAGGPFLTSDKAHKVGTADSATVLAACELKLLCLAMVYGLRLGLYQEESLSDLCVRWKLLSQWSSVS